MTLKLYQIYSFNIFITQSSPSKKKQKKKALELSSLDSFKGSLVNGGGGKSIYK